MAHDEQGRLAKRIKAARKLAGFRSNVHAARRFGWSTYGYGQVEAGPDPRYRERDWKHAPSDGDVERYADAFGVSVEDLTGAVSSLDRIGTVSSLDRIDKQGRSDRWMKDRRSRMRVARLLAGFDDAAAMTTRYGWRKHSVSAMENDGSPRLYALYAQATGTTPEWLAEGEGPSGYGEEVDAYVAAALPDVDLSHDVLRRNVDRARQADPSDMEPLRAASQPYLGLPPKAEEGDAAMARWGLLVLRTHGLLLLDARKSRLDEAEAVLAEVKELHHTLATKLAGRRG